jgi:multiple sugar transport system substrate-binding protein
MSLSHRARKSIRSAATIALALTVVGGIASCAPGGGAGAAKPSPEDTGPITLTWWDYYQPGKTEDALKAQLAEYTKANPNITIDRRFIAYADLKKSLLQSAGASSLPDIVIINGPDHQQFAQLGIAADLTSQLKDWGQLDKYPKGIIDSATLDGKIYGLPITTNCLGLFYNKDMFAAAGITAPPTTWQELSDDAKKLTTPDHYGLSYSAINNQQAVFQWLPTLWQAGGDLTDLTTPNAQTALEYWAGLMSDGSVSKEALSWDQTAAQVEFAQGRAAMMINGPWQIPTMAKSTPDLNYGVALLPKDKESATALGGENYMVINGPHEQASWDLIKWMQDPKRVAELAKASGSLPTRTDVAPFSDSDAIKTFTEQLKVGRPRAYGANYAQIADAVVVALQGTLSGSTSAKDALATAAQTVDPLLPAKK